MAPPKSVARVRAEARAGQLHHAYLITGPKGIGKFQFALDIVATVVCTGRSGEGEACGQCDACRRIQRGTYPDVDIYSLERQRSEAPNRSKGTGLTVETIRQISASASLRPFAGSTRFVVIEDAELMFDDAQEAFLKTLEEPPDYLVLMLLSDSADVFKPTVISRCQVIELRPIAFAEISARLDSMAVPEERIEPLAALSFGSIAWARIASEKPEVFAERESMLEMARSWIARPEFGRLAKALELGAGFGNDRLSVFELLTMISHLWRSILRCSTDIPIQSDRFLVGEIGILNIQPRDALRAVQSVTACQRDLESNVRPRLALAAMVTQWPKVDP